MDENEIKEFMREIKNDIDAINDMISSIMELLKCLGFDILTKYMKIGADIDGQTLEQFVNVIRQLKEESKEYGVSKILETTFESLLYKLLHLKYKEKIAGQERLNLKRISEYRINPGSIFTTIGKKRTHNIFSIYLSIDISGSMDDVFECNMISNINSKYHFALFLTKSFLRVITKMINDGCKVSISLQCFGKKVENIIVKHDTSIDDSIINNCIKKLEDCHFKYSEETHIVEAVRELYMLQEKDEAERKIHIMITDLDIPEDTNDELIKYIDKILIDNKNIFMGFQIEYSESTIKENKYFSLVKTGDDILIAITDKIKKI